MLKRQTLSKTGQIKITFVQPDDPAQSAISVVGDFNDWDPSQSKLVRRRNGTRSVSVTLAPGKLYRFRYYTEEGEWINDEAADGYESSEHGSENCLIIT